MRERWRHRHNLDPLGREGVETSLDRTDGLGLWLAQWIVEESGGRIALERDGPETAVSIRLRPVDPDGTAGSGRESEPSWTALRVRSRDEDRHRGGAVSSPVAAAGTNGAATGRTWNGRTGGTATEERKRHRGRVTATGGDRGDGGDQRDEHATRLREGDAPFERRSMEQPDR